MKAEMRVWTLLLLCSRATCLVSAVKASQCFVPSYSRGKRQNIPLGFVSGTERNLFFKAREGDFVKRKESQARIPSKAFTELSRETIQLPYQFNLLQGEKENDNEVTIRPLVASDLEAVVPMCVVEFGSPATVDDLFKDFPWQQPMKVQEYVTDWWADFALPIFIYWTFRFKIFLDNPLDHALLVATVAPQDVLKEKELVGLVELSQQPPEAYRNPSAYPVPLFYKQWYCRVNKLPPPNGWVTNLLIGPEFRGQGYSKLLMTAAEGVARRWGCTAIHLHCDANTVSGKVPQSLYQSLGYEMVQDKNSPYAWMGSDFQKSIYMIQGVALLYFRKLLENKQHS